MSDLTQPLALQNTMVSSMALDTTGKSPNNFVPNEPHTLESKRYRALVPLQGAYYTDSMKVYDVATGTYLIAGIDWKPVVPYQSLSLLYGHDIAAAVIIVNPAISNNVRASYQAVGSDYVYNIPALETLLSTDNNTEVSKSFLDLQNRNLQVVPAPHYHSLGDGVGFEYLVFAMEALCRVLTVGDNAVLASMIERVEIKLQEVTQYAINRQDGDLMKLMVNFRKNFSKDRLDLGNVPNYPETTEEDGRHAANPAFVVGGEINNRLVTLSALVAFRSALMDNLVSKELTGLGAVYGTFLLPTMAGIESMTQGATFNIDSIDASGIAGIPYDPQIYPDNSVPSHKWAFTKLSSNSRNRGGLLRATDMSTGQMFVGVMTYPVANNPQIVWRRHMTEKDIGQAIDELTKHVLNHNNPHKVNKADVLLSEVENLRVADRMTILSRKPVREYLTYDGFRLAMAAFVTGDYRIDDTEDSTPEQLAKARNAYTTLFQSVGACCDDNGLTLQNRPSTTIQPVPPRGQEAGWYCEGETKIVKITDGFGGYFLENIENAADCGYISEVANYEIRDQNAVLIGLGFRAGGRVDVNATITLQNADGETECFIYPAPAQGRTVIVKNATGATLGYAINPR